MDILIRLVLVATALGGVAWLWYAERESYAERKVSIEVERVKHAQRIDEARKAALGRERFDAVERATLDVIAAVKEMEGERNHFKALADARDRELVSLRSTRAGVRRSEVRSDPGSACHAHELRAEQLSRALHALQGSSIEVGESAAELESRLLECEDGARSDAVILRAAKEVIRSMRVGADEAP